MHKRLILFGSLFSALSLVASPVGNTAAPSIIEQGLFTSCNDFINLRLGYEGDFVADARLEQVEGGHERVDCYRQGTNAGTVTINILDRMDLYGLFGSSKTRANWRFMNPASEIVRIVADTRWDFLWAVGSRAILFQWSQASLGCGGRYSHASYTLSKLTSDGVHAPIAGAQFQWTEWQVNLDISYKIHYFTPYIGVKYSRPQTDLSHFSVPISPDGNSNQFLARDPVGVYLGCGLSTGKYVMLNIEGRLVDEEAITVSGDIRF